jgi:hypothetical protein
MQRWRSGRRATCHSIGALFTETQLMELGITWPSFPRRAHRNWIDTKCGRFVSNTALWLNAPKQHYISSRWASGTRNVRQRCHMGAAVWIPGGVVHCSCEPSRSWLAKSPDRSCSARMHLVLTLLTPYTVLVKLESVFGLFGKESW